ncbi:MAG: hydrogenase nickel incorporation protein HypB [Nitrospirae bacterium]|nr:hydrogenase nickel incorporation protein HypB [Nitrospirota bacterium]
MCDNCGCTLTISPAIKILDQQDKQALVNIQIFRENRIFSLNIMGSPGSGKTSLLEKTIELLGDRLKIGVIEGDLEESLDAERIRQKGVPAYQITTGSACHLDAFMVRHAMSHIPLSDLDIVFIENVGNLVCPAVYSLGVDCNVVVLSVTEGDDKPAKYPVMFRFAQVLVISKSDLLPYVDFDISKVISLARKVNPAIKVMELSIKNNIGMDGWINLLNYGVKGT